MPSGAYYPAYPAYLLTLPTLPTLPTPPTLPTLPLKHIHPKRQLKGSSQLEDALVLIALGEEVFAVGDVVDREAHVEAADPLGKNEVQRPTPLLDHIRRLVGADIRDAVAKVVHEGPR